MLLYINIAYFVQMCTNISEKLFAPLFQHHFSNRSLSLLSCLKRQFLYSDLHSAIHQNSIILTPIALGISTTQGIFLPQYLLIMGRKTHNIRKCLPPTRKRWRSWLRHCATSRKVAGSIPHVYLWKFSLI